MAMTLAEIHELTVVLEDGATDGTAPTAWAPHPPGFAFGGGGGENVDPHWNHPHAAAAAAAAAAAGCGYAAGSYFTAPPPPPFGAGLGDGQGFVYFRHSDPSAAPATYSSHDSRAACSSQPAAPPLPPPCNSAARPDGSHSRGSFAHPRGVAPSPRRAGTQYHAHDRRAAPYAFGVAGPPFRAPTAAEQLLANARRSNGRGAASRSGGLATRAGADAAAAGLAQWAAGAAGARAEAAAASSWLAQLRRDAAALPPPPLGYPGETPRPFSLSGGVGPDGVETASFDFYRRSTGGATAPPLGPPPGNETAKGTSKAVHAS
jgi:hypothetical protein